MTADTGNSAQRVVSLLPAATEMVCALGARERLVGVSHECDFPPGVETLPHCCRSRVSLEGNGADIDHRVRDIVTRGLSVYEVLADRLAALEPDLIITQVQCDVCAVSRADVEAAVCEWTGQRPGILSLEPAALRDVLADVGSVAAALGRQDEGRALVSRLRRRMRDIDAEANGVDGAPTVVCVEWVEPLMTAGNWVPELVDLAGGEDQLGTPGKHSPCIQWSQVCEADPDVLLVMPCGFDLARTRTEAAALARLEGYEDLSAVRNNQVFITDGHQFFNRPGPRLLESLEILAEIFHPQRFEFGHRGSGWDTLG